MLKSFPHQTFLVFSVLYFVFERSFFTLRIASGRNLEGSTTSGSSSTVDPVSTHLGESQLNGESFVFSPYFLLSSLFYNHLPALIGDPVLTQLAIRLCNRQGGMPCLWCPKAETHPNEAGAHTPQRTHCNAPLCSEQMVWTTFSGTSRPMETLLTKSLHCLLFQSSANGTFSILLWKRF